MLSFLILAFNVFISHNVEPSELVLIFCISEIKWKCVSVCSQISLCSAETHRLGWWWKRVSWGPWRWWTTWEKLRSWTDSSNLSSLQHFHCNRSRRAKTLVDNEQRKKKQMFFWRRWRERSHFLWHSSSVQQPLIGSTAPQPAFVCPWNESLSWASGEGRTRNSLVRLPHTSHPPWRQLRCEGEIRSLRWGGRPSCPRVWRFALIWLKNVDQRQRLFLADRRLLSELSSRWSQDESSPSGKQGWCWSACD